MDTILISKCLLGAPCRYKGDGNFTLQVQALGFVHNIFAICPEQEAGLPTPREPCSVVRDGYDKVIGKETGREFTLEYQRGAEKVLEFCVTNKIKKAFLVSGSPSCGKSYGLTAKLLERHGIDVISVEAS